MKTPIINNIKFQPLSFSDKENFEITINSNNFDKTRHRIVLQIANKTYMVTGNTQKIFLPRKAPTIPILPGLQPSTDLWVKAYVYDFKADEIILARKQEFEFSNSQQTYLPIDDLLTTTTMILGDFTKDKKVTKIEGPFDAEGNVGTQIKLGEQYTFKATPNQPVAEFYLLAIKWAYRLYDGELTFFKNQTEIANGTQGQITVTFPKSFKASKIKVYGFYKAASERVCVEVGTDYVLEEPVVVKEIVKQEENSQNLETNENCGIEYRNLITCTRYKKNFGPVYFGKISLKKYSNWESIDITKDEKEILIAMSENEGNLDAVQSYDSEILTAGAMQKTINSSGNGELAIQFWEFKIKHPEKFNSLLLNCGWDVKEENKKNSKGTSVGKTCKAFYNDISGKELKELIRKGFKKDNFNQKVICPPLEPIINLCKDDEFQKLQIEDFIIRLSISLNKKPKGHENKIKNFIKSRLGRAVVLDQDVNRPGQVSDCFGKALDLFFEQYPTISKNPLLWTDNFYSNEMKLIEIYGPLRGKNPFTMTDAINRYKKLKSKL